MLDTLREQFGTVMTLEQLAATLSRKREGLRMALLNPRDEWARELNTHKVYIGRRMYFPVEAVAALLEGKLAARKVGQVPRDDWRRSIAVEVVSGAMDILGSDGFDIDVASENVFLVSVANLVQVRGCKSAAIQRARTLLDYLEAFSMHELRLVRVAQR